MGHSYIGTSARTRSWRRVGEIISGGADAAKVANETLKAAEKAFAWVQENTGFREAVRLLTQMAVAAGKRDPLMHLAAAGVAIPEGGSMVDVALGVSEALDVRMDEARDRSDFGEVAQRALASAVTGYLEERMGGLFEPAREEMGAALKDLRKPGVFASVFRSFAANMTYETLDYFLSRELPTHLGHEYQTANQKAQFEQALRTHCQESSSIVEKYAEEWFSKHLYEEGGEISAKSAEGFGWYGMQKMRAELKARAKDDAN
ncbi:MAG TPA: hypothetical protein VFV96_12165 [Verrucomicrobiae bacterium]|nr:hypothetical protein [Verrucomicrobiae bacterium]